LPLLLDVFYGSQGGVREAIIGESLKEKKFFENIRKIHLQVQETLKKSHERYKA
jgi:hypothetical protein